MLGYGRVHPCAKRMAERSQTTAAPKLDTGITADDGGGQQSLGNTVDVTLGSRQVR